jgi:hypothetical protein
MAGLDELTERFGEVNRAEFRTPQDKAMAELTVTFDQLLSEVLTDPVRVDEQLRAEGFVWMADRLVELFGPDWWLRAAA